MTTVVILQSNYIPWRGYFDLIRRADHFVIYDTVQYTRSDWRNRNRIVTAAGPIWLTIPVQTRGRFGQRIDETLVADRNWASRHLATVRQGLARAPRMRSHLLPLLKDWYGAVAGETHLSRLNHSLISFIMAELNIKTQLHNACDLPQDGDRTGRLVSLCKALGATAYLSGPAAQSYLDVEQFADAGIAVDWMSYPEYPAYTQANGAYEPSVSILDALAHLPPEGIFSQ